MTEAESPEILLRLQEAVAGDQSEWQELAGCHRERLKRMVAVRLDQRMRSRVDASDVVQEALMEAYAKLPDYLENPSLPFYIWLRSIAGHKLMGLHRFHLGAERRNAGREVSIDGGAAPEATSAMLAAQLIASQSRPSEIAVRAEAKAQLQQCLDMLEPIDREIILLRHFEQMTNAETADILGITISAASKRYIRALERFKEAIRETPFAWD